MSWYQPHSVGDQGIEPCTSRSQTERSTDELVSVFVHRLAARSDELVSVAP